MTITLNKRVWVLVERLYIHCYGADQFLNLLHKYDIDYQSDIYDTFNKTKGLYTFMSQDNFNFASFMELTASYKYLPLLENIIFDLNIKKTASDNWNYYGEAIRYWCPELLDLLNLASIQIDIDINKLIVPEVEVPKETGDFLPDGFGDIFLDYIRKEINEGNKSDSYLSVMFLSRKILEVIVVRIFEVVFPKIKNKT